MRRHFLAFACLVATGTPALSQFTEFAPQQREHSVVELDTGEIVAADILGTYVYDTWDEYLRSTFFYRHGKKCGFTSLVHPPSLAFLGTQGDCSNSSSTPSPEYDPSGSSATVYDIPVVFHVFYNNNGAGNIPDARIFEQIDILNDDFANLTDSKIRFHLATEDPQGNATSGITRTKSRSYYNDRGDYASSVGWDTNRYLNIYSNTAGGNLGYAYVPNGGSVVGSSFDGVRLLWNTIGNTSYLPYNLGRTGTHEVGHYLGLFHTFDGGCGTSNCNTSGDLCCDTNPESSPNYSACSPSDRSTCGSPDPVRNYMDYSEDACMDNFSSEQAFRMRCTLENWRVDLTTWEGNGPGPGTGPIFFDGFEGGALSGWTTGGTGVSVRTTANTGSYAADLRRSSSMGRTINVGAETEVTVSWAWRTSGFDAGERIQATITGGSGGPVTVTYSGSNFASANRVITGVSGAVTIEFDTNASRNNERAQVDDVMVD